MASSTLYVGERIKCIRQSRGGISLPPWRIPVECADSIDADFMAVADGEGREFIIPFRLGSIAVPVILTQRYNFMYSASEGVFNGIKSMTNIISDREVITAVMARLHSEDFPILIYISLQVPIFDDSYVNADVFYVATTERAWHVISRTPVIAPVNIDTSEVIVTSSVARYSCIAYVKPRAHRRRSELVQYISRCNGRIINADNAIATEVCHTNITEEIKSVLQW